MDETNPFRAIRQFERLFGYKGLGHKSMPQRPRQSEGKLVASILVNHEEETTRIEYEPEFGPNARRDKIDEMKKYK